MRSLKSTVSACFGLLLCVFLWTYRIDSTNGNINTSSVENSVETMQVISPEDDVLNIKKQFFVDTAHRDKKKVSLSDALSNGEKRNVLFMITDDMRPQLACYAGEDFANPTMQQKMFTPHLDRLAAKSLLVKRAYAQYSLCGPSRASMLTSRRPDTTRIYGNDLYWRTAGGNYTTLPQFFKQRGYHSIGMGKIFHQFQSSNNQDPMSWSRPHYEPPYSDGHYYKLDDAGYMAVSARQREVVSPLTDEHTVLKAKKTLSELASQSGENNKPFFLALGFSKPHLNFVCPKKYFDMYEPEKGQQYLSHQSWQTPLVSEYCNMANISYDNGEKRITDAGLRYLRQAYFACISFVDGMVGEILSELDRLDLADSTIVAFVADHGHHLGENGLWGKQTNYESSTHVPMMIHIPGRTDHGVTTRSLVEAVDLYPTIVEAAGLGKVPPCPKNPFDVPTCTEGVSILPLIDNPSQPLKPAAFSQLRRSYNTMEYSIRTERYKYIQYAHVKKTEMDNGRDRYNIKWDNTDYWTMLYDLYLDPEERINRTDHSSYGKVRELLQVKLHAAFSDVQNVRRITKKL